MKIFKMNPALEVCMLGLPDWICYYWVSWTVHAPSSWGGMIVLVAAGSSCWRRQHCQQWRGVGWQPPAGASSSIGSSQEQLGTACRFQQWGGKWWPPACAANSVSGAFFRGCTATRRGSILGVYSLQFSLNIKCQAQMHWWHICSNQQVPVSTLKAFELFLYW